MLPALNKKMYHKLINMNHALSEPLLINNVEIEKFRKDTISWGIHITIIVLKDECHRNVISDVLAIIVGKYRKDCIISMLIKLLGRENWFLRSGCKDDYTLKY